MVPARGPRGCPDWAPLWHPPCTPLPGGLACGDAHLALTTWEWLLKHPERADSPRERRQERGAPGTALEGTPREGQGLATGGNQRRRAGERQRGPGRESRVREGGVRGRDPGALGRRGLRLGKDEGAGGVGPRTAGGLCLSLQTSLSVRGQHLKMEAD